MIKNGAKAVSVQKLSSNDRKNTNAPTLFPVDRHITFRPYSTLRGPVALPPIRPIRRMPYFPDFFVSVPFTHGISTGRRSRRRIAVPAKAPVHFAVRPPVGPCDEYGCATERFPAPGRIAPIVVVVEYRRRGCFRCRRRVRQGTRGCLSGRREPYCTTA